MTKSRKPKEDSPGLVTEPGPEPAAVEAPAPSSDGPPDENLLSGIDPTALVVFPADCLEDPMIPEVWKLIFHPGFSTAEKVTDISGRGVGMDVVRKNIESMRGKIDIASTEGKGSTFTLRLPLTLAITKWSSRASARLCRRSGEYPEAPFLTTVTSR